jgi:hypothetical protein
MVSFKMNHSKGLAYESVNNYLEETGGIKETQRVGKFFVQRAKKEKRLAYEMAVTLHLMGLSEASLDALEFAEPSLAVD